MSVCVSVWLPAWSACLPVCLADSWDIHNRMLRACAQVMSSRLVRIGDAAFGLTLKPAGELAIIARIDPDSAAAYSELRVSDRIVSIDGIIACAVLVGGRHAPNSSLVERFST